MPITVSILQTFRRRCVCVCVYACACAWRMRMRVSECGFVCTKCVSCAKSVCLLDLYGRNPQVLGLCVPACARQTQQRGNINAASCAVARSSLMCLCGMLSCYCYSPGVEGETPRADADPHHWLRHWSENAVPLRWSAVQLRLTPSISITVASHRWPPTVMTSAATPTTFVVVCVLTIEHYLR